MGESPPPPSAFIKRFSSELVKFGDVGNPPAAATAFAISNPTGVCADRGDLLAAGDPVGEPDNFSVSSLRKSAECCPCCSSFISAVAAVKVWPRVDRCDCAGAADARPLREA